MLRHSMGKRLLAISLAAVMALNSSSVTAIAQDTQTSSPEIQVEESAAEEKSIDNIAYAAAEAGEDESQDAAAQESDQAVEESGGEEEDNDSADDISVSDVTEEDTEVSDEENTESVVDEDTESADGEDSEAAAEEQEESSEDAAEDEEAAPEESAEAEAEEGAEDAAEESAAAGDTSAEIAQAEELPAEKTAAVSDIKAVAVDQNGEVIKGYESVSLPPFEKELALGDPSKAPVAIKGYEYVGAAAEDKAVSAIAVRTAEDGSSEIYLLTEDGEIRAGEQTVLTLSYKWVDVKRVYTYEDSKVKVTATLQRADAVPDDAELVVTPVTPSSTDYNYAAYMEALNQGIDTNVLGSQFTEDNTLLYDIAFMVDEKAEDGSIISGKKIEFQPEAGSVKMEIRFKKNQLEKEIGVVNEEDIEIYHLPLDESVLKGVDSTAEATAIDATDISVENVVLETNGSTKSIDFTLDGLSIVAVSTHPSIFGQTDQDTSQVNYSQALGRAVEYGIVADTYVQKNHQQTNFAVKNYRNRDRLMANQVLPVRMMFRIRLGKFLRINCALALVRINLSR